MKHLYLTVAIGSAIFSLAACSTLEGKVVGTAANNQVIVKEGEQKLNVGDKVQFSNKACVERYQGKGASTSITSCRNVPAGTGEVVGRTPSSEAIVKYGEGTVAKEGQTVEKINQ